ncbi:MULTISPECIES: LON peptidase substrate-binding domain-containing protein [Hymenobacter]|uniref:LON peptidase substrate-binding domain-containing protein n=2 Tax=Hymenobacter TaxID=89966 RepID=A0ABS6WTT9_9BACT|nr:MULTISPECIES: LON peptidase substrate-binding domain-containing protein [Hymenobacter]MBO3269636.1 LON peptidase substrate-binding domain-containing protein [Hymenobacter defluvii]MBW3126996.1 LON peptidase substrate-binding domain-containing protein [Hymenobacter profundi]MBW3127013.1 LON peptidase substrate-binding domain-containing protein [Hymenobacter profundi]QNE39301.1 peptidase [Hymenobacter sp. NBH84]
MARLLALFPLNLIVFPGEKLNLHIFEPRYRQLVRDCIEEGITFGIPPYLNNSVGQLGTEVKLLEVEKVYPSGEMDIRTQGVGVFRIREFYRQAPNKLYAAGKIEDIQDDAVGDPVLQERISEQVRRLYDILGLRKLLLDLPTDYRIFDVAHHLGMSQTQEYQLLAATSELERQELVREHLDQTLPVLMETERLKDRARLNGHFKNLTPPNF